MDANMNTSDENKQDIERRVAEGGVAEGSDAERDIERERGNDQVNEERDEIEFYSEMEEKDVAPFDKHSHRLYPFCVHIHLHSSINAIIAKTQSPRNADRCVVTEENDDESVVFSIRPMHAKILFLEIENIHIATDYCNIKTISFKSILY